MSNLVKHVDRSCDTWWFWSLSLIRHGKTDLIHILHKESITRVQSLTTWFWDAKVKWLELVMFSSHMTEETGESISPYDQVTDPFNCNISFKLFPTSASMGPWALADQEIQSSSRAFSALRKDGQVITRGHPECGGNSCNLEQKFRETDKDETCHSRP